jgi:hypothetical protein
LGHDGDFDLVTFGYGYRFAVANQLNGIVDSS